MTHHHGDEQERDLPLSALREKQAANGNTEAAGTETITAAAAQAAPEDSGRPQPGTPRPVLPPRRSRPDFLLASAMILGLAYMLVIFKNMLGRFFSGPGGLLFAVSCFLIAAIMFYVMWYIYSLLTTLEAERRKMVLVILTIMLFLLALL